MEGPQFSTKAESEFIRNLHNSVSVVGMTLCTEAKLVREAEIACGALPTRPRAPA